MFQFRVHAHSSRRCVNSKRRIALIRSNRNVQIAQHRLLTHTNWSTILQTFMFNDVFGPSAPRTCRRTLTLSQSPRRRGCRLRSPMRTPACCQPFGSGTVQRRAAVACRLSFTPRSARERWLSGEVRARRMARRSDEYSARSRCYSTQPHSTTSEESRITRMQKGTIIKGRPPFCHHQCSRTAARPRAALPRRNVQSTTHVPTT